MIVHWTFRKQGVLDPGVYVFVAKPSYQEVKYWKITGLTDGSIRCPITKSSGLTNAQLNRLRRYSADSIPGAHCQALAFHLRIGCSLDRGIGSC